jgi:hypothetical protein
MEVRKQFQIELSKRPAALENLNVSEDTELGKTLKRMSK